MTEIDYGLRFAAAVSCKAFSSEGLVRSKNVIAQAVASGLEPDALYALIERHRVHAIALNVLESTGQQHVLGTWLERLRQDVSASRQRCLASAMRGEQARRAIERAGIRCLNFKGGPNLSRKLYGDLALRHCKDIDLIVHPENIAAAVDVLKRDGWKSEDSDVWFSTWLHRGMFRRVQAHFAMSDPSTGCHVELHHRFERVLDPCLEQAWWRAFESSSDRQELTEAEFLYLVYHGTKHLWCRMKWLGDIAAVVEACPDLVRRSLPLARELGLESMLAPLATLLRELHGLELSEGLVETPEGGKFAALCVQALGMPNIWLQTLPERLTFKRMSGRCDRIFFAPRTSFLRRARYWLFVFLFREKDIEALGRFLWLFLPVLPLVRPCSWIWRRPLRSLGLRAGAALR